MAQPPALDAPVAGLGDGEALAKAWLLELLAARPLADAADLPADRLAVQGPALCAAVVGALVSDRELARLQADGDLAVVAASAGQLAGAHRPTQIVAALECLRGVVWDAIERTAPGPLPVGVAGRLAYVCAVVAQRALAAGEYGTEAAAETPDDELARVRAARGGETPLWIEALERQLAAGDRHGHRFALLLVDLDAAESLRLAAPEEAEEAFARVARAVRDQVRRGDVLAHEADGRIWVIASDSARAGASALALRIAAAVEASASLHGAPLTASVGIAVYPDDGRDAAALTAQAEEGVFAARAAGKRVGGGLEPDGPPEDGVRSGPWAVR
jgi:diguanylate cyclase (GGDEF)-like protein